ncbi:MAG: hypothetical protein ACD_71C00086G0002, partial [uncultured bacterium (gcode 4)]
ALSGVLSCFFDFFLTFSHFLYDRNASREIYPFISLHMAQLTPTEGTVTVNPLVCDFLVQDIWNEFKNCACGYDDMIFDMLFKKTWNSYGSSLHNRWLSEYQDGYREVVKTLIKAQFVEQTNSRALGDKISNITQSTLDGEENKKHWTDEDIAWIRKSFKCSRADAINMLNGAYHHEMDNIFATAAADDY